MNQYIIYSINKIALIVILILKITLIKFKEYLLALI